MNFFLILVTVFIVAYGNVSERVFVDEDMFEPREQGVNGNIQYLWAVPVERVNFFSPDGRLQHPLLPDWMREDLNLVAFQLYNKFLDESDLSDADLRDAESTVKQFKQFQLDLFPRGLLNSTILESVFSDSMTPRLRDAVVSVDSFRRLLGKVGIDFVQRMGFGGGTRFMYHARMWAEVLAPGDAVQPRNSALDGSVASGIVFTHSPNATLGRPGFELIDPRGHNPPFGKDEILLSQPGRGLLFPSWVNRMTLPHRVNETLIDGDDLSTSHRVDWAFEIGLFQFPDEVLKNFVDLEHCPFQRGFRRLDGQIFFNLNIEELVALEVPPELNLGMLAGSQQPH